jgi:isoleucyl-tRNA synthetase
LLESSGTRERAPYDAVLTHGFVMASDGRKMSKSIGNVIAPQKIIDQYGADILRQWVVSSDYSEDLRIGDEIIKGSADAYRKLRNTLRFLLGNLSDFSDDERIDSAEMPELDRWVLHRLSELDAVVRQTADDFEFHKMFVALYNFCTVDLSSFYFDIRKDSLYCDGKESVARRSVRTVLDHVFNHLTAWLAPILCFTAEEAWQTRNPDMDSSVHLRQYENPLDTWANPDLAEKWDRVRTLRKVVTGALEVERREKRIGASLQAHAHVYGAQAFRDAVDSLDFAEVCIASGLTFHDGGAPDGAFTLDDVADVGVVIEAAPGEKCRRCWKVLEEVSDPHPDLCNRCADTVGDH